MMENHSLLLVAEDDPDDQFMIREVLENHCPGIKKTRFLENGVDLLDCLQCKAKKEIFPNLVLLDLNMPKMDGRMALREIRSDPKLAHIPVVVLTTSQSDNDKRYCEEYGTLGYYSKPGSVDELENIIRRLCERFF